ncbi:MAG: DUF2071 domain-containing protein [Ferruginibacter sp.]|nr:DUF2071 domain-containing protein [Ferruginibacter sp.]
MKKTFLTADWKNLVMANYVVDPAVLAPYLPNKTSLDIFNGHVFVSLVGFMFANTRVLGVKIPFHVNFEEVNLRFYIRYNDAGTWKRGTVFIKEIVPRSAISFVANNFYNEKYSTMPMKHFYYETPTDISLGYHWKHRQKWNRIEATIDRNELPMVEGSEEEFIAEHYWGYSKYTHETTYEYEVVHPAWKVFAVKNYLVDVDFPALYGKDFSMLQDATPNSVFVAKGSPVSILQKRSL